MAKKSNWQDDFWLLLMQIYLRKPVGMKPLYSRQMVELSLELHIAPQVLAAKMSELARLRTPRIEHLWQLYSGNPRRLARASRLLREMKGFGQASSFYEGVELNETFERDFRPVEGTSFTPVMLTLVLDLYFRLTPNTMVAQTPEVQELARLIKVSPADVVEALDAYQFCDPYLNRIGGLLSPLLTPCQAVWQRYGNAEPQELANYAEQLKEYFKAP